MESPGSMEAIMAIGVGYVFMLTPAIIVFLVLRAQQNSLEKRLDALVQMSRISGEVVGVDEICQSLINLRGWVIYEPGASFLSPQRWEYA